MRFRQEEASESVELLDRCPEFVGCPNPGFVCNSYMTLWPSSYECLQFDSYRLIVVENSIWTVIAPKLRTCCDEPVETID